MNHKKGFIIPLIISIIAVLTIGGGLYFYKAKKVEAPENNSVASSTVAASTIVGGDRDIHGCIGSAGYSWCQVKNKCLRVWEEKCEVTNNEKYICPQAVNPSPNYCNGGKIISGGIDSYGCDLPPKCEVTACTPKWTCGWTPCTNGHQRMTAVDSNNCGLPSTGAQIACPALARICDVNNTSTVENTNLTNQSEPKINIKLPTENTCVWGGVCSIKWTSSDIPLSDKVSVLIIDKSSNYYRTLNINSDILLGTGSYSLTISPTIDVGNQYQIRICALDSVGSAYNMPCGESDYMSIIPFTPPTAQPTIEVLSPNGGEIWQVGNTYQFKWISSGANSLIINLDNMDNGTRNGIDIDKISNSSEVIDPNSGVVNWKVNNLLPGRYKVFMTAMNGNLAAYASSSNYFTIISTTAKPTINLLSPNGTESWVIGYNHDINYIYTGPQATLNFAMYRKGSSSRCFLGTSSMERGSFTVPLDSKIYCDNREYITPGEYKVEILALPDDTSLNSKSVSSNYFEIINPLR